MKITHRYTALFAAAAATVLIAACGEKLDDGKLGQVDNSVNSTQPAGTDLNNDAEVAANEARAAGSKAAATVSGSATDMAITTKVNAALAADGKLSALKINVDTEAGNVLLIGTAPDQASRDRATTLAAAVEGVVTVDNRLTVVKAS